MRQAVVLPLLSAGSVALAKQHQDLARALLDNFTEFTTSRAFRVSRTPEGDKAEHVATYDVFVPPSAQYKLDTILAAFDASATQVDAEAIAATAESFARAEAQEGVGGVDVDSYSPDNGSDTGQPIQT